MEQLRWGIVGPGCIAHKFAKAITNVADAELVAVASRSESRALDFAERYHIPRTFFSYEELANSDAVDAVYIATPHPFHLPCAELFLSAGKHVLCEKPLCVTARQAEKLKTIAERHRCFLMEAMWTRFLPAIQEVVRIVQAGVIGEVMGIRADFCYAQAPEEEPKLYQNHMAGGSLLDVGVYGLHFADLFLGVPKQVQASAWLQDGIDVHTSMILSYQTGAVAEISSAIGLEKPCVAWIYGTRGKVEVPNFYGAQEFLLHTADGVKRVQHPSIGDGFEEEIIEACNCIREGRIESEKLPLAKTITILEQMDEIRTTIGVSYPCEEC